MDQSKKTMRHFYCRDVLWETFEQMANDFDCSIDYLINEAMRYYARSKNYHSAQATGGPDGRPGTGPGNQPAGAAPPGPGSSAPFPPGNSGREAPSPSSSGGNLRRAAPPPPPGLSSRPTPAASP